MSTTERPILFSPPMVRAILHGRKTQTRRVLKKPENYGCPTGDCPHETQAECDAAMRAFCPYGVPGDRLWVREGYHQHYDGGVLGGRPCYRADGTCYAIPFKPSIHMPRWASRITLEVTAVRVERLQEITDEEAELEGAMNKLGHGILCPRAEVQQRIDEASCQFCDGSERDQFHKLWDSINAKRGFGWNVNPWVWVISFRRVGT